MLVYDKAFEINEIHQEIDCVTSDDLKRLLMIIFIHQLFYANFDLK